LANHKLKVIKMNMEQKNPRFVEGHVCMQTGEYARALGIYSRLTKDEPKNPEAHYHKGNALAVLCLDKEATLNTFRDTISLGPAFSRAYTKLAHEISLSNTPESFDQATEWLSMAREIDRKDPLVYLVAARISYNNTNDQETGPHFISRFVNLAKGRMQQCLNIIRTEISLEEGDEQNVSNLQKLVHLIRVADYY
jgi:tetratricopeptide (TPR) repeat protein